MKIILIVDGQLDDEVVNGLIAEIESNEPEIEINQFPAAQKSLIPFDKVMIFVGKAIGTLVVQNLLKAGVKWAKDRIDYEGDNNRPKFIQIFGAEGIPLAGARVLTTGEIEEVQVEKMGRMAPMPPPTCFSGLRVLGPACIMRGTMYRAEIERIPTGNG